LLIAGTWADGSPAAEYDHEAVERIEASGARVVAVAYGAPGQILWIERNQQRLAEREVRLVVGVGGALDYLSGTATRPPNIIRRLGLEWLFRLLREPWRWRRQRVLPVFAARVLVATVPGKINSRRGRT
jgi:N-acetylglucosaminyldiphosphoundecaprenol N-acetyl-beta-D-mannosaminyltransferase